MRSTTYPDCSWARRSASRKESYAQSRCESTGSGTVATTTSSVVSASGVASVNPGAPSMLDASRRVPMLS